MGARRGQGTVDFKGTTGSINTETSPPQSLTVPEAPEDVEDANVFYRNINFSTFKSPGGLPFSDDPFIAVWNKDTNEFDVRYGGGNQRVSVGKLQKYFTLIGVTDIRDVANLAAVLSSEEGSDEFNADANYAKALGANSLKELKDIMKDNRKGNKFSVGQLVKGGGNDPGQNRLGNFITLLRNYVKMIKEIKQQAGE